MGIRTWLEKRMESEITEVPIPADPLMLEEGKTELCLKGQKRGCRFRYLGTFKDQYVLEPITDTFWTGGPTILRDPSDCLIAPLITWRDVTHECFLSQRGLMWGNSEDTQGIEVTTRNGFRLTLNPETHALTIELRSDALECF